MRNEQYVQIIEAIIIAIVSVVVTLFADPLFGALGMVIALSIIGVVVAQHIQGRAHSGQEEQFAEDAE